MVGSAGIGALAHGWHRSDIGGFQGSSAAKNSAAAVRALFHHLLSSFADFPGARKRAAENAFQFEGNEQHRTRANARGPASSEPKPFSGGPAGHRRTDQAHAFAPGHEPSVGGACDASFGGDALDGKGTGRHGFGRGAGSRHRPAGELAAGRHASDGGRPAARGPGCVVASRYRRDGSYSRRSDAGDRPGLGSCASGRR